MKKIILLILISVGYLYPQGNTIPRRVDVLEAETDSLFELIDVFSVEDLEEVQVYEPVIQDSSILLYKQGIWSIFDLGEALGNSGGTNLEPELVVTPAQSKIVMDVDSVRVDGMMMVKNSIGVGDYAVLGNSGLQLKPTSIWQWNTTGNSFINYMNNYNGNTDLGNTVIWGLTNSSGSGLFSYNLPPYSCGFNSFYGQPMYFGVNSFPSLIISTTGITVNDILTVNDYTFPPVDGSAGTVMKTDGNGNLYWGSDIYGGGGGSGTDTASVLYHLSRYVTADSFSTYVDLYTTDNTTANTFTVGSGAGAGANKIALGSTTNTVGATATIKPPQITSNITLTLPNTTGVLALRSQIADSNFVLTSETSAWDKNSSNDRLLADTTGSGGNTTTRYQHLTGLALKLNKADSVLTSGYATQYDIRNFITDGNTNWNNSYGFITGTPITYPDANTIAFGGDAIVLDPATLEIQTGVLTAIGGANVEGDTSDYTINQLDSLLALAGTAIQNASMNSLAEFDTQVGITGTPSATTYWRGDNSWSTPTGSSGIDSVGTDTSPTLGGNLEINDKSLINTSPTFTVTATEVSYIDGLTSNAQAQINALEDSIQALNSKFQSILDALEGCCDLSDNTPPSAPTSLVATADNDTAKIRLTWTDPTAGDLDSIRIYRAVIADTSAYTYLTRVAAGVKAYTNTGLSENTAYWYKLKAVDDSSNVSGYSNRDSAKTFTAGGSLSGQIFYSDFESGTVATIFDKYSIAGTNTIMISDTAYAGSKGLRFNADDVTTGSFWVTVACPDVTKVYVSFWVYVHPTDLKAYSGTQKHSFVGLYDGNSAGNYLATFRIACITDSLYEWNAATNWVGNETGFSAAYLKHKTWQHIELAYTRGTGTNGIFKVKIDNDSLWSAINLEQPANLIDSVTFGLTESTPYDGYLIIDNIEIDSSLTRW